MSHEAWSQTVEREFEDLGDVIIKIGKESGSCLMYEVPIKPTDYAWVYDDVSKERNMNQDHEFETHVTIDGKRVEVTVVSVMDGFTPLIYGMFNSEDKDVTEEVSDAEYARIADEVAADVMGTMIDATDYLRDQEKDNVSPQ